MLHVTVADRAGPLAERLADVLRSAPADPMAPEWIATPSAGMRSWLWLELARHLGASGAGADGVAANLTSAFPGTLRSSVLAAARGDDEPDPWAVTRMVWTVLAVLSDGHDPADPDDTEPVVARFGRERLGYGRARRIADLFDRYHLHRPQLVQRWAAGDDVDVVGNPLPGHHRWQPHVWRQVRERIGRPSPPEELPHLLRAVRADTVELDLPERLSFFGLPVLPGGSGFVELAAAVAEHRDVHLFLLDPSPATSAGVRADALGRDRPAVRRRVDDPTSEVVAHPLLRSWGRLPRETALILADAEHRGFPRPETLPADPVDPSAPATVLARVQADLRSGRAPAGDLTPKPGDRSIQFHAAYGSSRQVDVARDAILHALAADPTLSEDDVLVVCPSLGDVAPLVTAGFGPSAGRGSRSWSPPERVPSFDRTLGPPALRYRMADRSLGRDNSVVAGLDTLLDRLPGRFDAVALQDLVAQPAIRARYGFTDEDLARIAEWVVDANVRWGLDADHRVPFGVPATLTANTWGAALDRLLLGSTVPDDDLALTIGDVAPLGVEGDDVDLAGRVADLVHRLREIVEAVDDPRPLVGWLALFTRMVDGVLAPPPDETWQAEAVRRVITGIAEEAADAPDVEAVELTFADVRRLLRERLAAAPSRPPFFRGGITVTSLDSLRWVPHRVIVLLGMDQKAFAAAATDGDDLAAALPLVGDREPRADRRLALLETVLAAGDQLIVIRDGHDLATNQAIPPAVVVAELLDTVAATVGIDDPASLEVHHPRHGFDERNFLPDEIVAGRPWSHDPTARAAAEARRQRDQRHLPFLAEPLADLSPDTFDLSELIDAVSDPIRSFVHRRLQVQLTTAVEGTPVELPVDVVGLERWKIGDRLVSAVRLGLDPAKWLETERRRGSLPPGALGDAEADRLLTAVTVLEEAAADLSIGEDRGSVSIDLRLPDGTRIVGAVADATDPSIDVPRGPARVGFGKYKPTYLLAAWVELLALVATDPDRSWRSVVLNYDQKRTKAQVFDLRPRADDAETRRSDALDGLAAAVGIARRARREPLPIFPYLTHAVREAAVDGGWVKASDWRGHNGRGDGNKAYIALAFGDHDLADLYALRTRDDDPFDDPDGSGRMVGWADYLWDRVEASAVDASSTGASSGGAS